MTFLTKKEKELSIGRKELPVKGSVVDELTRDTKDSLTGT